MSIQMEYHTENSATYNKLDESYEHNIESKKPDTQYILYEAVSIKLKAGKCKQVIQVIHNNQGAGVGKEHEGILGGWSCSL